MKTPRKKKTAPWEHVKVYEQTRGKRTVFLVKWYSSKGKRESLSFSSREAAEAEANLKEIALEAKVKNTDVFNVDEMREYEEFKRSLPKGVTPQMLRDSFFLGKPITLNHSTVTVDRACQEYIDSRKKNYDSGASSKYHYASTKSRLKPFRKAYGKEPISTITNVMLAAYCDKIKNDCTRKNHMTTLGGLFNFAKLKDYFPKDSTNPADKHSLERPALKKKGTEFVFTAEEMTKLLAYSPKKLLSWLVVGAFVGVRTEERARMKWNAYLEDESIFRLGQDITKTHRSRQPKLTSNFDAWLPLIKRDESAAMQECYNPQREKLRATKPAGLTWKHNILRHSYVSYHSELHGVKETSRNAGHSEEVLKGKYEHVVKEKEAKAWFSITPESVIAYCIKHQMPMPAWATEEMLISAKEKAA